MTNRALSAPLELLRSTLLNDGISIGVALEHTVQAAQIYSHQARPPPNSPAAEQSR
jgi:hypothetical protein